MDLKSLIDFHIEINKLKRTIRYESCKECVRDSTADHSWHLSIMVIDLIEKLNLKLDTLYSVKLAMIHDLCEYQGDYDIDAFHLSLGLKTSSDKKDFEEKAMKKILEDFNRSDIYEVWLDYNNGNSQEAKFVKAVDKLEALVHIIEIGGTKRENMEDADFIALYADKAVSNFPELIPYLKEVKDILKKLYLERNLSWKEEYDFYLNEK